MFGERLKILREDKDLKQKDLAKFIGVSDRTIGMYEQERREPDFATLKKLADFFDCSVDYLLGRTDDKDTIVVNNKVDGHDIEIGIDRKDYPNGLTPEQVDEVFKELRAVGFDVNKLIDKIKDSK